MNYKRISNIDDQIPALEIFKVVHTVKTPVTESGGTLTIGGSHQSSAGMQIYFVSSLHLKINFIEVLNIPYDLNTSRHDQQQVLIVIKIYFCLQTPPM